MSVALEFKHLAPVFPLVPVDSSSSFSGRNGEPIECMPAHASLRSAPHSSMVRSRMNVRKKSTDVSELAALIKTQGLLQNLVGYMQMHGDLQTGVVEIVAGGRRLEAIGLLIAEGDLPQDFNIPYLLVTEDEAIEISMAENRGRENMHPADVYEAMLALTERGRSIDDIAISFNLDALTVKRCLKLANISPRLLDLYRNDEANFEHMMALAISDSHTAQEHAWDSLGQHARYPNDLRRLLTAQQVNVQTDRLARYVGVSAFEKAGGVVIRDLFSDSGAGYISDVPLLERLAMDRLEKQRGKLAKEGYAWVEIMPRADFSTLAEFGSVRIQALELTEEQTARLDTLSDELAKLQERIESAEDDGGEDDAVLRAHASNVEAERRSLLEARSTVPCAEDRAIAGAIVTLDNSGNVVIKRDLIRPADKAKMSKHLGGDGLGGAVRRAKSVHSDRLTHILTSHRTAALQAETMGRPDIALVILTHTLISKIHSPYRNSASLCKISVARASLSQETKETLAEKALVERGQEIADRLPKDEGSWLAWLSQQSQPVVLELMAYCVACSLDATQTREGACPAYGELAGMLNMNMGKWWKATAAGYFNHVSMDRTIAVVTEAVSPAAAVPLEKMRKGAAAEAAERALSETTWLPEALRVE